MTAMKPEVFLALYCGSLFTVVFIIAPVLLRVRENKNLAGGFYGRILWRFYKVAFLFLMLYLILEDEKLFALFLMLGLALNVMISLWLKNYKKRLGDIDSVEYDNPKRVLFRRVSFFSTFVLFSNFLLSLYVLVKNL